jgi:hypothetical protein
VTTLTLIGKPDCHLCDVASEIIDTVIAELPDAVAARVEVEASSIQDDPALYELWWEKIPVVLIDGELHAHWRLSADRLRSALEEAATRAESSDDDRAATRAVLSDQRETK